ncbi:hypothetical protein D8Y22_02775 [Salinadaptatus halalkaliphilus]|uniref:Uncharacterized protein n=1 Tax=Salinadaptatus halalkaliphilus TaxID=2419781 RepID=A0A4S3TU90_9EURY|nr:hypothetical protein [Salinadaptatus halalkaliphilus]THE66218.1 hypothetical protein D8Y22_02775 [Salinadaptatus halalkaliphilus]
MSPIALLVLFCAAMFAITVGHIARGEDSDRVEIGTALVVLGITLLTGSWLGFETLSGITVGVVLLGGAGTAVAVAGLAVVGYYWTDPRPGTSFESVDRTDESDTECPNQ